MRHAVRCEPALQIFAQRRRSQLLTWVASNAYSMFHLLRLDFCSLLLMLACAAKNLIHTFITRCFSLFSAELCYFKSANTKVWPRKILDIRWVTSHHKDLWLSVKLQKNTSGTFIVKICKMIINKTLTVYYYTQFVVPLSWKISIEDQHYM